MVLRVGVSQCPTRVCRTVPSTLLSDVTDALQGARLVLPHQIESVGSHSISRLLLAYVELSYTVLTVGELP